MSESQNEIAKVITNTQDTDLSEIIGTGYLSCIITVTCFSKS